MSTFTGNGSLVRNGIIFGGGSGGDNGDNTEYMTQEEYEQITPVQDQLYGVSGANPINAIVVNDASNNTYQAWSSSKTNTELSAKANSADVPTKAQITNPNLLDNPWFTINQRGQSSYTTANAYTIDRWKNGYGDAVCSVDGSGITLSSTVEGSNFVQFIEESYYNNYIAGKPVTLSVLLSDGTIKTRTAIAPINTSSYQSIGILYLHDDCTITMVGKTGENEQIQIRFATANANPISIRAIKLELGSISTLALDTAPNYATELLKCQRYFYRPVIGATTALFQGINFNTTQARFGISLPTPMRTTPTITHNLGTRGQLIVGGTNKTVSDAMTVTINSTTPNMIVVAVDGFTGLTADTPIIMKTNNAYINLSADL